MTPDFKLSDPYVFIFRHRCETILPWIATGTSVARLRYIVVYTTPRITPGLSQFYGWLRKQRLFLPDMLNHAEYRYRKNIIVGNGLRLTSLIGYVYV